MDINKLEACIRVADRYMQEALKGKAGKPLREWINEYDLPEWDYNAEIIQKWWDGARDGSSHIAHSAKSFHVFEVK